MDSHLSDSAESPEMAFVLFVDLVAYSELSMSQQRTVKSQLKDIALNTNACRVAERKNAVVYRSTGDGLALVFFGDPETPVRCAMEMSVRLKRNPDLALRMGMHSGPVFRDTDISEQPDVVGGGINIAQRVMDIGDAGHILLSRAIADILIELGDWKTFLHDLGDVPVKHGRKVHLYNFYNTEVGNSSTPTRFPHRPAVTHAATSSEGRVARHGETRDSESSRFVSVSRKTISETSSASQSRGRYCLGCGMLLQNEDESCVYCGR